MEKVKMEDVIKMGIKECERCEIYPEFIWGEEPRSFDFLNWNDMNRRALDGPKMLYIIECPRCHKQKRSNYSDEAIAQWNENGKEYWRQQAVEQAAAAGEYKIAISLKREMVKKEIERAEIKRLSVMTETDLAYIDGRIQELKKFQSWLKKMEGTK